MTQPFRPNLKPEDIDIAFEKFYAESPFPNSGKDEFDLEDVKLAMKGTWSAGMTFILQVLKKQLQETLPQDNS